MKHNGWRKPTPGLVVAEQHAQAGEQLSIPKSQATSATKRVAAAIGLQAQDLLLLDTFAAFTKPQEMHERMNKDATIVSRVKNRSKSCAMDTIKSHALQ